MSQATEVTKAEKLKVLVPFNFSAKSERALDFALVYSQSCNADVYLFHVLEGSTTDYRRLDKLNEEFLARMREVVTRAVTRLYAQGVRHNVEEVHRRIAHGQPSVEILRMAAGISCDMIVLGAPRTRDFKRLFLKAPCTLVAVREKDPEFVMP